MDSGLPHDVRITFPAKYDSNCPECSGAIYEGDPIGFVDDVCVCPDCHEIAQQANRAALRAQVEAQRERDRAEDPEKFDRQQAAVKKFTDAVKARRPVAGVLDAADAADMAEDPAATTRAKEAAKHWLDRVKDRAAATPDQAWVALEGGPTPGWVRNPHHVPAVCKRCNLTVPCDCEPEPLEQEAPVAVEPGIQALMAAGLLEGQQPGGSGVCVAEIQSGGKVTEVQIPVPVDPQGTSVASAEPVVDRVDQLAAAAADWTPAQAQADALQASLQAAVDAGTMTKSVAAGLGWLAPAPNPWEPAVSVGLDVPWPGLEPAVVTVHDGMARQAADVFLAALEASTPAEEPRILDALDSLPAYVGRDNMEAEKRDLLGVIVGAIENHPRSLQVKIGPSEIGTECDHCLAAKLAGWAQSERGEAWLPTIGTAVHSWIEQAFRGHPDGPNGSRRFLTETRVAVGEIDGEEITGSTDLADVVAGWTWDWKIVGPTTLKSAKVRPSRQYVVQQMLYARGWNRLGVKITHVGIAYLPRNAMSLNAGVWWSAPYDPEIAEAALERATNMARNLKAMLAVGGAAMRDSYITGLPRWREWVPDGLSTKFQGNGQEGRIICMDCPRYPDYPADAEPVREDQLEGLI